MTDTKTPKPPRRRFTVTAAAIGLVVAAGAGGVVAGHAFAPPIEMAPMHPVAIRSLPGNDGIVTIKGRIAETYGNRFVIDDGTARALVDTGPRGDRSPLAGDGAIVTVQGHFDRGQMHASFLVDPAGKVIALGPQGGPPHGHPGHDRGPADEDRGPPPPAPAAAPDHAG